MTDLVLPKRLRGQHQSVKRSAKQEREIAARTGGNVTKGSGSGDFEKGDVRVKGVVRIEAKTTQAESFRVTKEMIDKITSQALQAGEIPTMEIEIDNQASKQRVAVVPCWALDMLIAKARGEG